MFRDKLQNIREYDDKKKDNERRNIQNEIVYWLICVRQRKKRKKERKKINRKIMIQHNDLNYFINRTISIKTMLAIIGLSFAGIFIKSLFVSLS